MKVVAFVPIKLNNERLPNKNIMSFTNGKPLITYILNTLLKAKYIDEIYVYCSSESIISYLPAGIKFLKRNPELDTQTTTGNDILNAFVSTIDADIYVVSHVTTPFISVEALDIGVNKVISGKYDSALTVTKFQDFLWVDGKPANYDPSHIPRTQDLPKMFTETCGVYILKKEVLTKYGRRIGLVPYLIEVSKIEAIDIDNKEDFIIADALYNYLNNNYKDMVDGEH